MARRRSRNRPRGKGGLWTKVFGKRLFGRRPERGLFGIDAALVIAFFTILMTLVGVAIVTSIPWVIEKLGNDIGLAPLLIHVPGIADQPLFPETTTSGLVPAGQPVGFFTVSTVMGQLYGTMQLIAFVGLIIAAILLGITYVSEQFNIMRKGTALQLLSESALILVLLFIFPIIFNASAAAINALNQQVILKGNSTGMIKEIINGATSFGLKGFSLNQGDIAALLLVMMQATVSFGAILTAAMAGVGRLLITGVLAAAFPLILVLRLIPPLRNIATTLQGALIGLMVGTILVSLVVRVSWGILSLGDLSNVARWAFGSGTLAILAVMVFVVAQGFGSVGRMMQGAVVGPASAVVGGTLAAGGGMVAGMTMGGMGAAAGIRGMGLTRGESFKAIAAGQRAGLHVGRGGALAALTHGPSTGREAAHKFGAGGLGAKIAGPYTSMGDELAEHQAGNIEYLNWYSRLSPTEKKLFAARGRHAWGAVKSGAVHSETYRRVYGTAYGKSPHLFKHLEEGHDISRHDYEAGIKSWYNRASKDPTEKERADIYMGYLFSKGAGKLPKLGEDVGKK